MFFLKFSKSTRHLCLKETFQRTNDFRDQDSMLPKLRQQDFNSLRSKTAGFSMGILGLGEVWAQPANSDTHLNQENPENLNQLSVDLASTWASCRENKSQHPNGLLNSLITPTWNPLNQPKKPTQQTTNMWKNMQTSSLQRNAGRLVKGQQLQSQPNLRMAPSNTEP